MKLSVCAMLVAIVFVANTTPTLGKSAPSVSMPAAAEKTIVIKNTTRSVNVYENDTVLFIVGNRQFALKFDGNQVYYDLSTLAPPGVLTRKVKVYVAPNPRDHEQGIP